MQGSLPPDWIAHPGRADDCRSITGSDYSLILPTKTNNFKGQRSVCLGAFGYLPR